MKKILLVVLALFSVSLYAAVPKNSMLDNGLKFLGVPYVAHTLEVNSPRESLVVNLKQVDCTTFVEYVLARSLCNNPNDEAQFEDRLRMIRYRDGVIDGYTSRLHYSTEWVMNGLKHGYLTDVAAAYSKDTTTVHVSFMSAHPDKYVQLKDSPADVARIAQKERELSGQVVHYIPREKLPVKGFKWIHDGDIILLVTNMPGLDNSHLGIAIYQNGELHLLHASSLDMKVKIQEEPLREQLMKRKGCLGIRVVRMKK